MRASVLLVSASLVLGCASGPTDETPSGAVQLFIAAMERSHRDPAALEDAYALLAEDARARLAERAHLAVQVGGRRMEPWEMIAASRSRLAFPIRVGARGMRESVDGDRAVVTVRAQDRRRSAEVPLVREDGRWRIVLAIPSSRERREAD